MRRNFTISVLMLGTLSIATALVEPAAALTRRISFKRGTASSVVTGTWRNRSSSDTWLIKVGDDQQIRAVGSKGSTVFVTDPNGDDVSDADAGCNSEKTIEPTVRGDYRIQIVPCEKYDPIYTKYKLTVFVY